MKHALLIIFASIVIFALLVAFNWMCLSDAQAQDPTPTAETFLTHSFGYRGVPIVPAREVVILGALDYSALEGDPLYLGHDIVAQTIYQRYIYGGVCFALVYALDVEARRGDDGMPHPEQSLQVECD